MNIDKIINAQRKEQMANSPQWTLGELIDGLTHMPCTHKVYYDFGDTFPCGCQSWRGSYDELALSWTAEITATPYTVDEVLNFLNVALMDTFNGYKGGEYKMTSDTPVWVANWGRASQSAVVGVKDTGGAVIILTQYCDYL